MDGATLQSLIYKGNARAAAKIGTTHQQYRPTGLSVAPLDASNLIGTAAASFNIGGAYNGQNKPDQILWQAIVDGAAVQIGDYLVGEHTWAIVGMDQLMPIMAMRCTDTVTIKRNGGTTFSATSGAVQSEATIATNVPCYIQLKRDKGFSAPAGFPAPTNSAAPMPEWLVYICLGGVLPVGAIKDGDLLESSDGQTWKVDAASSSTLIWQLACVPYQPDA